MKNSRPVLNLIAVSLLGLGIPFASDARAEVRPEQKAALEKLKAEFRSGHPIEAAAEGAEKAGVPRQTVAEVRLLSSIRSRTLSQLPSLLTEIEQQILPHWRAEDSTAFEEKSELEALAFFGRALLAEEAGDEAKFEETIKQAFWANPAIAPMLSEDLKARRTRQRLATVVLPMDLQIETSDGNKTSLADLARGQKALLLDFWATWCGPCMSAMPELLKQAKDLAPQKVLVVGINTEASDAGGLTEAKKKAENVKKQKKVQLAWLVEPIERPISKLLKIDTIPRAILVNPEGKVLYDGHPEDNRLAAALQKIGVSLPE
jgi:thiol-disulfide isomerase/thioredoxin